MSCRESLSGSEDEEKTDPTYEGDVDQVGEPHGQGTLTFPTGDVFKGEFKHGVKHGKGKFEFEDGSTLTGVYKNDELEGKAVYVYDDGSSLHASYINGDMNGPATEYDCDGQQTFIGQYKDNIQTGLCWLIFQDGGSIVGQVDENGQVTGNEIAYVYPDKTTALIGQFKEGGMVSAVEAEVLSIVNNVPKFGNKKPDVVYESDESNATVISSHPLKEDPYEAKKVYVKDSVIPGAKEGLFARVDTEADTVMSFYNGIRLTHKEVDERDWSENSNTISLDDETVIDVPEKWIATSEYKASLGHKANHSFTPNSKYDMLPTGTLTRKTSLSSKNQRKKAQI